MESSFSLAETVVNQTCPQTPPRGLNGDEVERVIVSPSADTEEQPEVTNTFETVALAIQEVPIREINRFDGIQDYRKPTLAERPIVGQTPRGYSCIDGWDMVEAAASDGQETISCEVEVMAQYSDVEISIRKATSRIATRGGQALYPEIIRNVCLCDEQLRASDSDLRSFGRGGRRFGDGFADDLEKDIVHTLSFRFKRDRDTITTYRQHGKYLSDATLQTFVEREAPKKFFEKHQTKKQRLLDELEEQRATEIEKVERVSAKMLEFFDGWQEERQRSRSSRGIAQTETRPLRGGTPPVSEPVPHDEGEHEAREEDVPSEAEDLTSGNIEGDSDDVLSEPEVDRDEGPAQSSSSNEVEDEGYSTIEDEQAPSPRAMTIEDIYDAIDSVAERLADLPDMDLSPVAMARSIEQEIGLLDDLRQQLLRIED